MLGQFICSTLENTFGYLLPAYQTYKLVESKEGRADQESLKNCCIYWGIIGTWTICERVLDKVLFWVPLYDEFKVAFVIWLWYDQCGGAKYLYRKWLLPWLSKHQSVIDQQIEDIRNKIYTLVMNQSSQFLNYLRTVFFRVLFLINQIHQQTIQEESEPAEFQEEQFIQEQYSGSGRRGLQISDQFYDSEDASYNNNSTSSSSSLSDSAQQKTVKKKSIPLPISQSQPAVTSQSKSVKNLLKKRKGNSSAKVADKKFIQTHVDQFID